MPENIDDDDYVANLLKQDAKKSAKQYEMVGLEAFKPARPNTRFLRHIIRETDNHNTTLLAKEAEESRARLRRLERTKERDTKDVGRLTPPDMTDHEIHHRKRKRSERYHEDEEDRRSRKRTATSRDTEDRSSRKERDGERNRRRHRERSPESDRAELRRHDKRSSRHRHHQPRSAIIDENERTCHGEERRSRRGHKSRSSYSRTPSRSPSPRSSRKHRRSRSDYSGKQRSTSREARLQRETSHNRETPRRNSRTNDSDSDPLEALVGPLPPAKEAPVRARGRGAAKANSMTMDARFSSTYNPSADVQLQSEDEDEWGDALEVLRDRQRWKKQGADRLKAAGFTEQQVEKWENGDEKTEDDVTWSKQGQREWDRGKTLNLDGEVDLKADWGRLK